MTEPSPESRRPVSTQDASPDSGPDSASSPAASVDAPPRPDSPEFARQAGSSPPAAVTPVETGPMKLRRGLFRAMLAALALGAVLTVGAIIAGDNAEPVWRVVGLLAAAAGCAGWMYGSSFMLGSRPTAASGRVGLGAMALIWPIAAALLLGLGDLQLPVFGELGEELGLTLVTLILLTMPAQVAVLAASFAPTRWLGGVMSGVIGLAAGLFLLNIWLAESSELFETTMAQLGYGLIIALCLAGSAGPRRVMSWMGVAAALVGFFVLLIPIWSDVTSPARWVELTVAVTLAAATSAGIWVALQALLRLAVVNRLQSFLVLATLVIGAAGGVAMTIGAGLEAGGASWDAEPLFRAGLACIVLTGCGALATLVLNLANRAAVASRHASGAADLVVFRDRVDVTCPDCGLRQSAKSGRTACARCRLQFELRCTEPFCTACGYSLRYRDESVCPECGATLQRPPTGRPLDQAAGEAEGDAPGSPAATAL